MAKTIKHQLRDIIMYPFGDDAVVLKTMDGRLFEVLVIEDPASGEVSLNIEPYVKPYEAGGVTPKAQEKTSWLARIINMWG